MEMEMEVEMKLVQVGVQEADVANNTGKNKWRRKQSWWSVPTSGWNGEGEKFMKDDDKTKKIKEMRLMRIWLSIWGAVDNLLCTLTSRAKRHNKNIGFQTNLVCAPHREI